MRNFLVTVEWEQSDASQFVVRATTLFAALRHVEQTVPRDGISTMYASPTEIIYLTTDED